MLPLTVLLAGSPLPFLERIAAGVVDSERQVPTPAEVVVIGVVNLMARAPVAEVGEDYRTEMGTETETKIAEFLLQDEVKEDILRHLREVQRGEGEVQVDVGVEAGDVRGRGLVRVHHHRPEGDTTDRLSFSSVYIFTTMTDYATLHNRSRSFILMRMLHFPPPLSLRG